MEPSLHAGDVVFILPKTPRVHDIAIASLNGREVIKRVQRIEKGKYYLVGDNRIESIDSRHYGFVSKTDILGTIMIVLPKSVHPPKPVLPYGHYLGRAAALILVAMTVAHLFRIDTFIPIIDTIIPGAGVAAVSMSLVIILSEVFAIPFALRMKLSPLAHIMSGALVAFAPLWWLLLTVWAYGSGTNTGQLGEFVFVPANGWIIALNAIWVVLAYFTLYALGYNRLKMPKLKLVRK